MKFISIELENIFAYDRKVEVNLSGTSPERNVILIWGRNGMGKTSFLNSLKLLFLGADLPDMRTIGFPPRTLPPRQYVLGDDTSWSGVINRRAQHRALTAGVPVTARVKAKWEMPGGGIISAERQWVTTKTGYSEGLVLVDGEQRLTAEAAADRLEDFVPREFVRFFFFDSEDIKQLAETAERKQIDFDRLLRITFVQELASELRRLASERGRNAVSDELRENIRIQEEALTRARVTKEGAAQKISELDDLIAADVAELRRLNVRRENLSAGASDAQRAALEERQQQLKLDLARAEDEIVEAGPAVAPILANLDLLERALEAIADRLSAAGAAEQVLARRIQQDLPLWIREAPVDLSPDVAQTLASNLSERIGALVGATESSGFFRNLDAVRAGEIHSHLQRWSFTGPDTHALHVSRLINVRRIRRELADIREALMQLEVGSQANLEQYRLVVGNIENIEGRLAELNQQKGLAEARRGDAEKAEQESAERLAGFRAQEQEALKSGREAGFILKLSSTMDDLREAMRVSTRAKIVELINERFRSLVFEHGLIDKITIDDTWTLTYLDAAGRGIGRASLSSGLKQLAATALLWAMKDTAGEDMPVVIDTPLGRIDRENQDQMLLNYYPRLSSQVIVLPTNTEIDERKRRMLLSKIAAEYTINNPFGDSADIIRGSLLENTNA